MGAPAESGSSGTAALEKTIAGMVAELLGQKRGAAPAQVPVDAPLFAEGLGLDSADSLQLVVAIEDAFGVRFEDQDLTLEVFRDISSLAEAVAGKLAG